MFGRQPKLTTRYENQQEKGTHNQENIMVNNNRLRIARVMALEDKNP